MQIYGAEMSFGVGAEGLDESLRYLQDLFPDLSIPLVPLDDIDGSVGERPNLKRLKAVAEACRRIEAAGSAIMAAGDVPLFVGGDHAAAIGTVAASAKYYPGEALIWIDAHSDIHKPETTASGNIHGMPTAVALGRGEPSLLDIFTHFILPEKLVFLGLRDVDPPEVRHLEEWGIRCYSWETIRARGLDAVLAELQEYLTVRQADGVHISLDIDGIDPAVLPGVSVPVAGGFRPEEAESIIYFLCEHFALRALDVVEYNHLRDQDDRTGRWLAAFLKRMLSCHRPIPSGRKF